jgi:hypothetical protein
VLHGIVQKQEDDVVSRRGQQGCFTASEFANRVVTILGPTKWLGNRSSPPPAGPQPCGICGVTTDLSTGDMLVPIHSTPCEFHSHPRLASRVGVAHV